MVFNFLILYRDEILIRQKLIVMNSPAKGREIIIQASIIIIYGIAFILATKRNIASAHLFLRKNDFYMRSIVRFNAKTTPKIIGESL